MTVREFSAEDDKRVTIIFDTRLPRTEEKTLTLREKIDAEQRGKTIVASTRFEEGVSLAASMIAHFSDEQAEFRLVIDGDVGDFGIGRTHLYACFKRLAVVEPNSSKDATSAELEIAIERIFNERDDSHRFLITANGAGPLGPDIVQRLKIVGF